MTEREREREGERGCKREMEREREREGVRERMVIARQSDNNRSGLTNVTGCESCLCMRERRWRWWGV